MPPDNHWFHRLLPLDRNERRDALTFIRRMALFVLCYVLIDATILVLGYPGRNLFADISNQKIEVARTGYLETTRDAPVLVLGSSHAQFGVDTEVLSRQLGMDSYNLAFGGGTGPGNQVALIESYLQLKTELRVAILCLDVFSLNVDPLDGIKFVRRLMPEIELVSNVANSRRFDVWRHMPRLNAAHRFGKNIDRKLIADVLRGRLVPPLLRKGYDLSMFSRYEGFQISAEGHVRGHARPNLGFLRYDDDEFEPRNQSVEYMQELVTLLQRHSVEVVLVQIPEHAVARATHPKYEEFDAWVVPFAESYGISYFNFNQPESFSLSDDDLFFDTDHLNARGASLFSSLLGARLRDSLDLQQGRPVSTD